MAVSEYEDPRFSPPMLDPNKPTFGSTTYGSAPTPTFGSPMGPSSGTEGYGGGGGIPIIEGLKKLWHLFTPNHPTVTPPTTQPTPPKSTTPSTTQQVLGMTPELIALITALLNRPKDPTANNPALAGLNAAVPQLMGQLNSLMQNDVQRRQMSDPLYQAVLRGTMGGLPVWMRGGSPIDPPVVPTTPTSPTTSQV